MSIAPLPPLVAGRYRPVRTIARGGMGVVYEVEHVLTSERLALKVLMVDTEVDPETISRFKRESSVAARIKSEHVVRVIDAGVAEELGGAPFLVMDLLVGEDLEDACGQTPQPPETVLEWLRQVALGLAKAHALGLVHRDLKPANLFLTKREDGSPLVKILDFGIVKQSTGAATTTVAGRLVGTPLYMAPEQASTNVEPVTFAADLYALALIAFRLMAGRAYRRGETVMQVLAEVLSGAQVPPSRRGLDLGEAFDAWFTKSTDRDPPKRFSSAPEQIEALAAALGFATRRVSLPSFKPDDALPAPDQGATPTSVPAAPNATLGSAPTVALSGTAGTGDATRAPTKSRLVIAVVSAAAIAAVGAVVIVRAGGKARNEAHPRETTASSALPAAAKGVPITELELAEKPAPEAERLYREALQDFRIGLTSSPLDKLQKAVAIDPSFAAAHLQLSAFIWNATGLGARESYLQANRLRDRLSARDDAFLKALEPCVLPEVSDYKGCGVTLAAAAARYPEDAQLAATLALLAAVDGRMEESVLGLRRALELDPRFAGVEMTLAMNLAYMGRFSEARSSMAHGLSESPTATLGLVLGGWIGEQLGDRAEFDKYARLTWVSGSQTTTKFPVYADSLFTSGKDREAVEEALGAYWRSLPEKDREWNIERDHAALDVLDGELGRAARRLEKIVNLAVASDDEWCWVRVVGLWLATLREIGDAKAAATAATRLLGRLPTLPPNPNSEDWGIAAEATPILIDAQLRGEAIDQAAFARARDEWVARWRARAKPYFHGHVWLHGYAAHTETPAEARATLAVLPSFGQVPPFRPLTATNFDLGRTYLLAGQRDEALRYLDLASKSSAPIEYPLAFVRSHLYLGIAKSEAGDKAGACQAFSTVVSRWGKARPRSMSAEDALTRMRVLGCP